MFMFYKFIWNGGNDRVQRACIHNNYNDCGLRMIDPYHFSWAQKMIWVKLLHDDKFQSFFENEWIIRDGSPMRWCAVEIIMLPRAFFFLFFLKMDCIVLCLLIHSELGISIVNGHVKKFITPIFLTWWISVYGITEISDPEQSIIFILKTGVKGILTIFLIHHFQVVIEELVLDFDISRQDRGKFNFLMKWIPSPWLEVEDPHSKDIDIFDNFTFGLFHAHKIPEFTYSLLNEPCLSNRDTEYLIAEKSYLYCYILFLFCYYFRIIFLHPICWQILNLKWL